MNTWLVRIVLTASLVTSANLAFAQDPVAPTSIPDGRRCHSVEDGQLYWCASPEEYAQLLLIEEEVHYWFEHAVHLMDTVSELQLYLTEINAALADAEEQVTVLTAENFRLYDLWKEENRLRHEAEVTGFWDFVPWVLAVVEAAVILGGVLVLTLD